MSEYYPVPAEGTVAYQYFEVPTTFTEDKWIQAMEVRASNPSVLHHVIVYARTPAPATPPAAPPAASTTTPQPRPTPVFIFSQGTGIPAGQSGGPALPPDQQKPARPNDRPAPRRI